MAAGIINLQKASGGVTQISGIDGTGTTQVMVPESGALATEEGTISKSEVAYNVNTSSFIPNTLTSGAIIEKGSNINGEYVKFADGLMLSYGSVNAVIGGTNTQTPVTYPSKFSEVPAINVNLHTSAGRHSNYFVMNITGVAFSIIKATATDVSAFADFIWLAIGKWK